MHSESLVLHKVSKTFKVKSRKIYYDHTGNIVGSDDIARDRLFELNRKIYHRIIDEIPYTPKIEPEPVQEKVKTAQEILIEAIRDGSYFDKEYFEGTKGYKPYTHARLAFMLAHIKDLDELYMFYKNCERAGIPFGAYFHWSLKVKR